MKSLQKDLLKFRDARPWKSYHTPENLVLALCGEMGELAELFQWDKEPNKDDIACEIADIMIYALNLCNTLNLDAETIIRRKMERNEEKYPC